MTFTISSRKYTGEFEIAKTDLPDLAGTIRDTQHPSWIAINEYLRTQDFFLDYLEYRKKSCCFIGHARSHSQNGWTDHQITITPQTKKETAWPAKSSP